MWLRLAVLLPLLPVVYADREPDAARNLRARLATALLRILIAPAVRGTPGGAPDETLDPTLGLGLPGAAAAAGAAADAATAAAAAARAAGESLFERLAAVQHALLGGTWASWLRGDQVRTYFLITQIYLSWRDKLREVAEP